MRLQEIFMKGFSFKQANSSTEPDALKRVNGGFYADLRSEQDAMPVGRDQPELAPGSQYI
jgi:hypothetical protein